MEAEYEIAGIRLHIKAPFKWEHTRAFWPFSRQGEAGKPDVNVIFRPGSRRIASETDAVPGERYVPIEANSRKYLGYRIYDRPCFAWMEEKENENEIICWYLEDSGNCLSIDRQLFYIICPEQLLNRRHGFVLHSSFVRWNERGILFSAPSGTGKSTQAALWEKYAGAEILNGDRTAVRKTEGQWTAFGFPFAGSSDIYRNESAPVAAVFILKQSEKNCLTRLKASEAFRKLYSETTIHPWDTDFLNRFMDDLMDFIEKVPVYLLACRPEKEAVDLVKKVLEESENG